MKNEVLDNLNHLLDDLSSNNQEYYKILEKFEDRYFSTKFNTNIDEVLSKSSLENLVMHYISYQEFSKLFLSMLSKDSFVDLNPRLKIEGLSRIKIKLLFLLIYKELNFFTTKIEDFLNIDSRYFQVERNDDVLIVKINNNNNEIYKINSEDVIDLKEKIISYYYSEKKISSFANFINEFCLK